MDENDWDDWGDEESQPKTQTDRIDVSIRERPVKTSGRKGHFTAWEDQVIIDDWQTTPDKIIGHRLGRTEEAISRRRKHLGLSKKNGRPKNKTRKKAILTTPSEYNLAKLSKDDRIEFYKTKFDQNPRYGWLLRILLPEELEYYKGKYITTIDSLDSITMQEEDLLHNMIMKEIQIMRLQSQIKEALEEYYKDRDEEDEPRRPPQPYLYQDLDKAEQQFVKYQEKMKMTREQRLKTDREEKITITNMVRSFLEAKNRQHSGDMAGQMDYYVGKCEDDMSKMSYLLGTEGT